MTEYPFHRNISSPSGAFEFITAYNDGNPAIGPMKLISVVCWRWPAWNKKRCVGLLRLTTSFYDDDNKTREKAFLDLNHSCWTSLFQVSALSDRSNSAYACSINDLSCWKLANLLAYQVHILSNPLLNRWTSQIHEEDVTERADILCTPWRASDKIKVVQPCGCLMRKCLLRTRQLMHSIQPSLALYS